MNADSNKNELKESTDLPPLSWELLQEGLTLDGDNGCPPGELPPWFDREKFYNGQRVCRDNFAMLLLGFFIGLVTGLSEKHMFQVFASLDTQKSSRGIGRRFLGTSTHLMNWYDTDVLDKKSAGYRSILAVRCYHKLYMKKLPQILGEHPQGHQWLSQTYMTLVLLSIIGPAAFKFYGTSLASNDDLEAMTYFWRVIGYLLGISDRYNACRDGFSGLCRLSKQSLEDMVVPSAVAMTPEMAALTERTCDAVFGTFIIPVRAYEMFLKVTAELLNNLGLSSPRLTVTRTLSWKQRIGPKIFKTFFRSGVFSWPPVRVLLTALGRFFVRMANPEKLSPEPFPKRSEPLEIFVCPYAFKS